MNTVQAMRGIAATLVVVSHIIEQTLDQWRGSSQSNAQATLLGGLGVYIFFVISGFIMQCTAGPTFGEDGAPNRFLRRRIARIVPLYWLLTTLAILFPQLLYRGHDVTIAGAVSSYAFFPDTSHLPNFYPALIVGWTLSFEMLFYIAFAASLWFPRRIGIPVLMAGLLLFVSLMHLIAATSAAAPAVRRVAEWWNKDFMLMFAIGVLIARYTEISGVRLDRRNVAFTIALALVLSAAVVLALPGASTRGALENFLLAFAPISAVWLSASFSDVSSTGIMRGLVWIGDRSYGLYLSHLFVLGVGSTVWLHVFGPRWLFLYAIMALGACVSACWPLYNFVELPITKLARRILSPADYAARPDAAVRI